MKYLRILLLLILPFFILTCAPKTTVQKTEKPVAAPTAAAPVAAPQFDWSKAVLYFAIVDRFADGDPSNDSQVDVNAKGTFHGGDLKGLIEHLDEISQLGVNAL